MKNNSVAEYWDWWKRTYKTFDKHSYSENLKSYSLIDHKAYCFYRDNSELCNRRDVAHYVEYGKLIGEFYKIVGDELVNAKGGVYIKNFGYFGIMRYIKPSKRALVRDSEGVPKTKLNILDDWFFTSFIPISKNNKLRLYSLDLSYFKTFRKKLTEKLRKGYLYYFNASLFYSDLNMRNFKYKL